MLKILKLTTLPSPKICSDIIRLRFVSNVSQQYKEKLSYSHVPSNIPLSTLLVGDFIDISAENYPDREAVRFCHQEIFKTFAQLKTDVDQLAGSFLKLGLKKGERIGVFSPNCYEWVLTQFAAAKTGLITVCVNPAYQASELAYCLTKVGVSTLVSAENFKTQDYYGMLQSLIPSLKDSKTKAGQLKCEKFPALRNIIVLSDNNLNGTYKFNDVFNLSGPNDKVALEQVRKTIDFDDPTVIQFTSGTTGNPKGACLSHFNVVNNSTIFGRRLHNDKKVHRICNPLPLYHNFSYTIASIVGIIFGDCIIYPSAGFHALDTLKALQNEKASMMYGTPTMYFNIATLSEFAQYDLSALKIGIIGGSAITSEFLKDIQKKFQFDTLSNGYGSTETSPGISMCRHEDSEEVRFSTIGYSFEHQEIKIVNPNGLTVPTGIEGEIWTRGYHVMAGYWNDEAKTDEAITSTGWYRTGDVGSMDEKGYLKILGRIKDMLIRGGENIYPAEIEAFLMKNENIANVAIIGVPDEKMGEEICACICLKPGAMLTEQQVKDFCKNQIAHFKIPRYVHFFTELPLTVSGKVKKFELKKQVKV